MNWLETTLWIVSIIVILAVIAVAWLLFSPNITSPSIFSTVGAKMKGLGHFISHHWGKLLWTLTLVLLWLATPAIVEAIKSWPAPPPPIVDETKRWWKLEITNPLTKEVREVSSECQNLRNNSAGITIIYPIAREGKDYATFTEDFIPAGKNGIWENVESGKVVRSGKLMTTRRCNNQIVGLIWQKSTGDIPSVWTLTPTNRFGM